MKFRGKTLLAKLQPDPAVDPAPDGSNAIITEELSWDMYEGNRVTVERDRLTLGNFPELNTSPQIGSSFNVDFSGAGDSDNPDQPPGYGVLLRACGLSETIDTTVSEEKVIYQPVSDGFEEIALYFLRQGILHKGLNCKGNVQISLGAEQLPRFQFDNFVGKYVKPTAPPAGPAIVPAAEHFVDSVAFTKDNTPVFTFDETTFDPCINSFTFNLNNTVTWKDEANCQGSIIEDRRPSGEIVIKAPNFATKDLFAFLESHQGLTTTDVKVRHGTADGNIVEILLPVIQFTTMAETEVRGELYYTIGYNALPDEGDDEIQIIVR